MTLKLNISVAKDHPEHRLGLSHYIWNTHFLDSGDKLCPVAALEQESGRLVFIHRIINI